MVLFRSYFSRLTQEPRKNADELSTAVGNSNITSINDHDQQWQEHEDNNDFDSAVSSSQAYELLGKAIHTLDEILSQQQSS
ncbi:unnamed protein product [Rotaria sordida]|uniref:Uncharacterized protein n=2 Tax=Rotaria sordida TaxID=392033 RepID=A0A815P115_9BILA|nr:unnamed protein product [Rotaria sordida]